MIVKLEPENIEHYLKEVMGQSAKLEGIGEIGQLAEQAMKEFGYGKALEVTYTLDGKTEKAVFSIMKGDRYGHQHYWDRAAILLFEHYAGSRMEKHARPLGIGYVDDRGWLVPVKDPQEFFIVHEKIEGETCFTRMERIRKSGLEEIDLELTRGFARWLAGIHSQKRDDPDMYLRTIRQLIGDSECIWGLVDAYPHPYELFPPERFQALEKELIGWRWKLRGFTHRLSITHGDFHPWNIIVRPDGDFTMLDRSRGESGDPADDVASMSANYILYALYEGKQLDGDFGKLYTEFWDTYLAETGDHEMLEVIAPFYVFRGLVMASPEWYPNHPVKVRRGLLNLVRNVIEEPGFDYRDVFKYTAG